jgi:glycosyltransferase involved in cell wall biosynthesis
MAAGLPVVASAVGGVPELLGSGRHGRLLPPAGDAGFTDAFSEAVLRLASHPEERRAVGAAGRSFIATEYSMKTAVETLENAYLRLVG